MQQDDHNLRMEAKKTRNTVVKEILSIDILPLKYTKKFARINFRGFDHFKFFAEQIFTFSTKIRKIWKN